MLLLTSTSDVLKVVTGSALTVDVHASWVDYSGSTVTPGRTNTAISTSTTTTVVAAPASSTQRNVKTLTIRNKDVSADLVTVQHYDGSTTIELFKYTLQSGDTLMFCETTGFLVISSTVNALNYYSTADQTITAAATALLTGSLVTIPAGKLQIGTQFYWTMTCSKTAAGTAANTFDVRVGTLGTSSDTSRLSFALPTTATGVVDVAYIEIVAICRGPLSGSGVFQGQLALSHNLAATGFAGTASVNVNTTSSAFDVTTANLFVSVSCTTAASTVLTFQQVQTQVLNLS